MDILAESGAYVKPLSSVYEGDGSGHRRPVRISQIIRAMSRAKKPYQGVQVWLTEAGEAALTNTPANNASPANNAALKNEEDLTLAEQIAEVHRRYSAGTDGSDHLVFRGTVAGDFVHVSLPVEGEEMICWRGYRVTLPKEAFEGAAKNLYALAQGVGKGSKNV